MNATLRLFNSLVVKNKRTKKLSKTLLEATLQRGFVFSENVNSNYTESELLALVDDIGLSAEEMNSSFHKSWNEVKNAPLGQLIIEQLLHYITTYGFERVGIYDESTVFIPCEELDVPDITKDIKLTIVNGYTLDELKEKVFALLKTGIALKEQTLNDILDVCKKTGFNTADISEVKNKEAKCILCKELDLVPEQPTEFLRYCVYTAVHSTLLIKSRSVVEQITKFEDVKAIQKLFANYAETQSLEKLSTIFYRFKPLFLAFRQTKQLKKAINKVRRFAVQHHKAMQEDYLNSITSIIKKSDKVDKLKLEHALEDVNLFRKIRLAYALKYRTIDTSSILYQIRNGKGFASDFETFSDSKVMEFKRVLKIVLDSISNDLSVKLSGKKIYLPENLKYSLPATEKQFIGNIPSGSYVDIKSDMVAGVFWKNKKDKRVDLDLSLLNRTTKYGWDASYRSDDRDILFSGDVTDAPNGASELYYVKRQLKDSYIMMLNYFNYFGDTTCKDNVEYDIIVASEKVSNMKHNYTIDANNVVVRVKSNQDVRQKVIGLLTTTTEGSRFYFIETSLGNAISSGCANYVEHARTYLCDYYSNSISLKSVLDKAGVEFVATPEDSDIDLSQEKLEKDTFVKLLS